MKKVSQKYLSHDAFTMIELIFVIVILGILSAVALPRFAGVKNQADISKARTDVAAIRSSIMTERQSQLIKGNNTDPYIPYLSSSTTTLFTGDTSANPDRILLRYGIVAGTGTGKWAVVTDAASNSYTFTVDTTPITFDYNATNGNFSCSRTASGDAGKYCKNIID